MSDLKYKEITEKIIGAAMKVHSKLGNGFPEVIYQRALEIQLRDDNIVFQRECIMAIYYNNIKIGDERVDFLIENKICVELKAITLLEPVHFAQARNYLEAFNPEVGLLINFGSISLGFKRIENPKFRLVPNPFNQ
jgi:GxxExxY protein